MSIEEAGTIQNEGVDAGVAVQTMGVWFKTAMSYAALVRKNAIDMLLWYGTIP